MAKIEFVTSQTPQASQRDKELARARARSHASRVSHQARRAKSQTLHHDIVHHDIQCSHPARPSDTSAWDRLIPIWEKPIVGSKDTEESQFNEESSIVTSPLTILGWGNLDPF